ncbi:hypothetical protein EHW99_1088 [Erwinia amylovora]|nr:hypothetical protein EHX00_1088 [Erwinia amylovora]QJQ57493.1 hypothetical protein EHW99_1088 [Erwinia amylovora]QJQ61192.1 hypothetical protein EHW98_1088 [Erwinia amylovora]QJQ64994.1 hypothetical protein EHW96_1088 [Erwinia amylovora]QJQ68693.1 hypothetical protein EGZ89_1088 [Erwinia amylovora]
MLCKLLAWFSLTWVAARVENDATASKLAAIGADNFLFIFSSQIVRVNDKFDYYPLSEKQRESRVKASLVLSTNQAE